MLDNEQRRKDAKVVLAPLKKISDEREPADVGAGIIGFGTYKCMSGDKEIDWPRTGFSPRKGNLML